MATNVAVYDYIVIGGGVGGIYSALTASQYGAKVALIEEDRLGGTCVNAGCARKKVTWDAASIGDTLREAKSYGFSGQERVVFDWTMFKKKSDAFVKKLNDIYQDTLRNQNIEWISGKAKFVDRTTVVVKEGNGYERTISAQNVLVAVGGRPRTSKVPGAELGITSDGFFELEEQPKKVAVVGEGYIAVELAGTLHALGTETHLFVRKEGILRSFDPIIQETILAEYERQGIHIHDHSDVVKIENCGEGSKRVCYERKGSSEVMDVDCVLWAIGRVPQTEGLDLEKVGIEQNVKGEITVNHEWRTNVDTIYAVGDVCDKGHNLTPVAVAAGTKLSRRLFGKLQQMRLEDTHVPSVIFAHPPIGTIGLSEQPAREVFGDENVQVVVHRATVTYYWAMMEEKLHKPTVYKMVCAGKERRVVGLHIVGRRADELLQGFAVAIRSGATLSDFDDCLAVHPTASEELVTLGKVGQRRMTGSELDAV